MENQLLRSFHFKIAFWLGLFLFSLAIRVIAIKQIPPLIGPDEIQYVSEAKSLLISGQDIASSWSPWSLSSSDSWYAELPSTLLTPGIYFFGGYPQLSAKLTHLIFGSLFPLVLGLLSYALLKNYRVAVVTALISGLNPWLYQFSRLALESYLSLFLGTLGLTVFLYQSDRKKLISLVFLFFSFFQYQGHKVLLLPLTAFVYVYQYISRRGLSQIHKYGSLVLIGLVLITGWFIFKLPSQKAGSRVENQLTFLNLSRLEVEVNQERRLSLVNPWQSVFSNKLTVLANTSLEKYLAAFDLKYLFFSDDYAADSWAVTTRGKLYLADGFLFFFGLFQLIKKGYRREAALLLGAIAISPLPNVISSGQNWVTFRAAFFIPFFLIIVAYGLEQLRHILPSKFRHVVLLVYLLGTFPFFYDYFFRYPVLSTRDVYFSTRVVASYLKRLDPHTPVTIYATETPHFFETILHYNNWLTAKNYSDISTGIKNNIYRVGTLQVSESCFSGELSEDSGVVLVQVKTGLCPTAKNPGASIHIASLIDSGSVLAVYNDPLCQKYHLPPYVHLTNLTQLNLEQLSDRQFCETYFVKY